MQLLDYLTSTDKAAIEHYLQKYVGGRDLNANIICEMWNKKKRTLFKALGKKLRVSIPVELDLTEAQYVRELSNIYATLSFSRNEFSPEDQHPFLNELVDFMLLHNYGMSPKIINSTCRLFRYNNVQNGMLKDDLEFPKPLALKIPKGTKIMRAIRKFLIAIKFPRMDLFEQWRNEISNLNTSKSISGNLVLSIHPLDMLTLSHNNCGWTSCYNISTKGVFSKAIFELINSNIVLTAYMESNKKFIVDGYEIPNKSWRMLMYCHKDIIMTGKPYPYLNEELAKIALDTLKQLVQENLGWKYQYGPQTYKDMKHLTPDDYPPISENAFWTSSFHAIGFYTNEIYNDVLEDGYTDYWCYRNYVPRTKTISISGPKTCIKCGETMTQNGFFCCNVCESFCSICGPKTPAPRHEVLVANVILDDWPFRVLHEAAEILKAMDQKLSITYTAYNAVVCEDCLVNKYLYLPEQNVFILKINIEGTPIENMAVPVERKFFAV